VNLERLRGVKIAVLLGGTSPEREVSLKSGNAVLDALRALGADARAVDPARPDWRRRTEGVELAFIALHGVGAEDGPMQGALELQGIPYTGSGVLASALTMDKVVTKTLWRGLGLPTPEFVEIGADCDWEAVIAGLGPAFVKPVRGGSSIGIAQAATAAELLDAWREASKSGDRVIAERLIDGPEYTVSVLGGESLPAIRIETDNAFYDYEAKYLSADTRYLCPCGLDDAEEREIAEMALRAFETAGCKVWGRVDLMRDGDGTFYLLEINTVPGMTDHSLVPMAARAAGIGLNELVGRIACLSLGEEA